MELNKKIIHTNHIKPQIMTQLTLDDDFNIPDNRADVEKITLSRGEIEITDTEILNDKIRISGLCHFYVLYQTDIEQYPVSSLSGTLPFEETVNSDSVSVSDIIKAKALLEDLNISIINSRKLSIRCLINLRVNINAGRTIEAATEIEQHLPVKNQPLTTPPIECLYETIDMTTMVINKKDIYRLRQEIALPANKPNLYEILWSSTNLNNSEIRLEDSTLQLSGNINLFILYASEEDYAPIQFIEMEVPFKGELTCENCSKDMISNIDMRLSTAQFAIKPDNDGQQRFLDMECILELDIKLYQEEHCKLLSDAYSTKAEVTVTKEPFEYSQLILKNNAKAPITHRLKRQESQDDILQICHVEGQVKIDEYTLLTDGIKVEGVITADALYISSNDNHPVNSTFFMIPFHYVIEMDGINEQANYEISSSLEQLNINMIDNNEFEMKANVNLCAIAFQTQKGYSVKELSLSPLDSEKMQNLPGMVGYIVKDGDTLWQIAKRYYTTVDSIVRCNQLENEEIHSKDKLLIVK